LIGHPYMVTFIARAFFDSIVRLHNIPLDCQQSRPGVHQQVLARTLRHHQVCTPLGHWERRRLQTQPPQQARQRGRRWQRGWRRPHAAAAHCPAAAAAAGRGRQARQPPFRGLAHRLQPLDGHHPAVFWCPPSSSGAHTSTAAAATSVRRPTGAVAPALATVLATAAAVPAPCCST
jgi:hypothetical protein